MTQKISDLTLVLGISVFDPRDLRHFKCQLEKRQVVPEFLGLGGQVPLMRVASETPEVGKQVVRNMYLLRKQFRNLPVHVYGAGDHRWYAMLRLMGATSADYAGYVMIASKGGIVLPGTGPRFILKRVKVVTKKGVMFYTRPDEKLLKLEDFTQLVNCSCPICKCNDLFILEENRDYRIIHNLYVTLAQTALVDSYCNENDDRELIDYIKQMLLVKKNELRPVARYALKLYLERGS